MCYNHAKVRSVQQICREEVSHDDWKPSVIKFEMQGFFSHDLKMNIIKKVIRFVIF